MMDSLYADVSKRKRSWYVAKDLRADIEPVLCA